MKKSLFLIGCALSALILFSCGSTPEPEPAPVTPEVPEVVEEVKEVIPEADFGEANKALMVAVDAVRENAVNQGAKTYFADGFNVAENEYNSLTVKITEDSKTDYSKNISDLKDRYESLAIASQAKKLKEKADSLSLQEENKASYDEGTKALEDYENSLSTLSGKELLEKSKLALSSFNDVVNKGLKANAARERNAALEAKKRADSVKAGVAKKEEYTKASETFKKADSSYVTADIEGAWNGYKSSKEAFDSLYNTIYERRAQAQALIDAAKQKVNASQSYAEEADSIAPLTEQVAGIETEETVLLKEDNFENPENAVINVEEGVTASAAEKIAETAIAVEEAANEGAQKAAENVENAASEASKTIQQDLNAAAESVNESIENTEAK